MYEATGNNMGMTKAAHLESELSQYKEVAGELAGIGDDVLDAMIDEFGDPNEYPGDTEHVGWKIDGSPMSITFQMMIDLRAALSRYRELESNGHTRPED